MTAAARIVEMLNAALREESDAIIDLFLPRIAFVDPDNEVPFYVDENWQLSLLGIINGIVTTLFPSEGKCVATMTLNGADVNGLLEFAVYDALAAPALTTPYTAESAMDRVTRMLTTAAVNDHVAMTKLLTETVPYKDIAKIIPRGTQEITEITGLTLINAIMRLLFPEYDKWIFAVHIGTDYKTQQVLKGFMLLGEKVRWDQRVISSKNVDSSDSYCPYCDAKTVGQERRIDGNSFCERGHTYPTKDAKKTP